MYEKKSDECNICSAAIIDESFSCRHYSVCEKCSDNGDTDKLHFYYGQCIYCIMDGQEWHEEWDSWDEIANRVMGLFQFGVKDGLAYIKPYQPSDSQKAVYDSLSHFGQEQVASFRKVYNDGFSLGKELNKYGAR